VMARQSSRQALGAGPATAFSLCAIA
jgi:hypothetical protein